MGSFSEGIKILEFSGASRALSWFNKNVQAYKIPPGVEGQYTVLIAQLEGDLNNDQRDHISQSLQKQFKTEEESSAFAIICYPLKLPLEEIGNVDKNLAVAEAKGQKWLKAKNAQILIWGKVARADDVLRLRFLSAENKGAQAATAYKLTETLELPSNFADDFSAMLMAEVAMQAAPAFESGQYVSDILKPVLSQLHDLAQKPPKIFDSHKQGYLLNLYGAVALRIGEESEEKEWLEEAERAFNAALKEWTRDKVPLNWASTKNNLGNALMRLGERESDPERLQEAVDAYREALTVRTREKVPLDWAMTQNNLGNALMSLGERESDPERLQEAVDACREALKERTRDKVPLDWAGAQNNLGNALMSLGERESGPERLQEAVDAYREALKERTRDKVPLDWATTQNNLGAALARLGERESGPERLQEAVDAYREALTVWTREEVPLRWAMTQNNLGNALMSLGERESGPERLQEAVNAYREALTVWTREEVPLDWAGAQNNLGAALARLGERESGPERLQEAVDAYRDALKERTRDKVPLDWAMTQNNLGATLASLGERESDPEKGIALLNDAVTAYRAALEIWTEDRHPYHHEVASKNLAMAQAALDKLQN